MGCEPKPCVGSPPAECDVEYPHQHLKAKALRLRSPVCKGIKERTLVPRKAPTMLSPSPSPDKRKQNSITIGRRCQQPSAISSSTILSGSKSNGVLFSEVKASHDKLRKEFMFHQCIHPNSM